MPMTCRICNHPRRPEIEGALASGQTFRRIAKHHGTSVTGLFRHRNHAAIALARAVAASEARKAIEAREVASGNGLLAKIEELEAQAHRIGEKAEAEGDYRTVIAGIRELIRIVELQGKLFGKLQDGQMVNVLVSGDWQAARAAMFDALADFPEARIAVSKRLMELPA